MERTTPHPLLAYGSGEDRHTCPPITGEHLYPQSGHALVEALSRQTQSQKQTGKVGQRTRFGCGSKLNGLFLSNNPKTRIRQNRTRIYSNLIPNAVHYLGVLRITDPSARGNLSSFHHKSTQLIAASLSRRLIGEFDTGS